MLGRTNISGGGGTALNFKVVRYASESDLPETAKENTIAFFSDVEMSSYVFDVVVPTEPIQGMVWFLTGTSSTVAFNALKKNAIEVYPLSAKQYVDGEWVDVTAKSYQNGTWVDWILYLYKSGQSENEVKAKWTTSTRWYSVNAKAPTLAVGNSNFSATISDTTLNYQSGVLETTDGVDLTNWKTVTFEVSGYQVTGSEGYIDLGVTNVLTGSADVTASVKATGIGTYTLDVSALSGVHDIFIKLCTSLGTGNVARVVFSAIYLG